MSPLWGYVAGIVTLVVMLAFIGIWVWAWLPHHKPRIRRPRHASDGRWKGRAMTEFWSGWVILLAVFTLGASLFLFIYGLRVDIPTQPDGTSGHVWAHGVLRESVRSLPVWWIVISAIGFVAAFVYLALYPGFGAFKGFLGWTAHDELARDQAANRQLEAPLRERVRGKTVESIATDPEALRAGGMLFVENCAACHGRNASAAVDIRRSPTARPDTCGRTACCARVCGIFRPGGSGSRYWDSSPPSPTLRSILASARSRAFSAGPRTMSSHALRPQTANSKRRCASASAARRSNPSPPTQGRCARAECCSSRTARHATAETGEATQRWVLRISPTVTGSTAATARRS